MATYTVTGHPLNPSTLATTPGGDVDPSLLAALDDNGVGDAVSLTLAAPVVTEAEGAGVIEP